MLFNTLELQLVLALVIVLLLIVIDVRWGIFQKCANKMHEHFSESMSDSVAGTVSVDALDKATGPLPTIRNLGKKPERDITGFNLRANLFPTLAVDTGSGLY